MKLDSYCTVTEAAKLLGLSTGRIRQLVGTHEGGEMRAVKISPRVWLIPISEVRRHAKIRGKKVEKLTCVD